MKMTPAVVAAGIDPARQGHGLADVFGAELMAKMRAVHG